MSHWDDLLVPWFEKRINPRNFPTIIFIEESNGAAAREGQGRMNWVDYYQSIFQAVPL